MHPVRGIGVGAMGFGALAGAFMVGVFPSLNASVDLGVEEQMALRSLAAAGITAAMCGLIMAWRPGVRPVPWDFGDWLEELGWGERGAYLVAVVVGSLLGLWLYQPWEPLVAAFE